MTRSKLRQIRKKVKEGGSLYWKRKYWTERRKKDEEPDIEDIPIRDPGEDWLIEVEGYFPIDWYAFNNVRHWSRGNDSSDENNIMMATFGRQSSWRQLEFKSVKRVVERNGLYHEYDYGHTIIEMLADAGIVVEGY